MLIVLPVSQSDFHLVPNLAKVFIKLGGLENVEALIVTIRENIHLAEEYARLIRPAFKQVDIHLIEGNCPTGWPQACNYYFTRTAQYLEYEKKLAQPWFFFEADMLPVKEGWYNALLTEYNLAKKPFMGVRQVSWSVNPRTQELVSNGDHMVGTGIYPPNMSQHSCLYKYVTDQPWDVFCQWEIVPKMHATTLIQHQWSTANYRLGYDDSVICDDAKENPYGITHNKPLRPDALLLHGCKDSSLAELVLSNFAPGVSESHNRKGKK